MRTLAIFTFLMLVAVAAPQGEQRESSLFLSVRPDVTVVVQEHPTSADLVEVTALDPDYPIELLQSQIQALGESLGSPPRGLSIQRQELGTEAKSSFIKAKFATDGLIDRSSGRLRLQPIVRAFAGAPEPFTVRGMSVIFQGESGSERTLASFSKEGVIQLEAVRSKDPYVGIEYRVKLVTQEPTQIEIPDEHQETPPAIAVETDEPAGIGTTYIVLLVAAALALGALVYFALLKSTSRIRR